MWRKAKYNVISSLMELQLQQWHWLVRQEKSTWIFG
jgi:hypothetical protein